MLLLVVNAGSSSLKLRLLDQDDRTLKTADLPADTSGVNTAQLADVLRGWPRPDAVGHRIVHGGTQFTHAVLLDPQVTERLRALTDLAPLHQPKSLAALDAVTSLLPGVAAVACFDTAFHTTLPAAAATYAVPPEWRQRYGVRRYGFHGLSHAYCTRRTAQLLGRPVAQLRLVTCHLGAGASLAAVVGGHSVDTTMGFTPLEGLVMATRSGSVDPGLVLWLEEHEQLTPHQVATALEERSGLLALTGSADMRQVEVRAAGGEPDAELGMAVYLHRLITSVGAMVAACGGLDALVFTGGVGENSATVRRQVCEHLAHLGISIDTTRNTDARPDLDIADADATVRTLVIAAREDLQIAHEARYTLEHHGALRGT